MSRIAHIQRNTSETKIDLTLNLDGSGQCDISTGIGFFDHMLNAWARHGRFDLKLQVEGDLEVDGHHSVEDTGIALGAAVAQALGDKRGINRFASEHVPMDETLVLAAIDISGRGAFFEDMQIYPYMVGGFDSTLTKEFFIAFAANAGITLHIRTITGENLHHIIEACFKSCGRALRRAVAIDEAHAQDIPSTKGVL